MADWKTPENAKYTENDEWIIVDGNTAKIGLTDYAQDLIIVQYAASEIVTNIHVTLGYSLVPCREIPLYRERGARRHR